MAITIPQSIRDRVAKKEADEKARKEAELQRQEREQDELKKINELRASKRSQLEAEALFIVGWLRDFLEDPESKQLFGMHTIDIFGAKFYNCRPTTDRHVWAKMSLQFEIGYLFYKEAYNTPMGSSTNRKMQFNLNLLRDFAVENDMVNMLHPDYILQFAEAIRSGKVWEFVERSIG